MPPRSTTLLDRIYDSDGSDFERLAFEVFAHQRANNPVYAKWLTLSGQYDRAPATWREIPCLPIALFRGHDLRSGRWVPETTFRSSGTTGAATSEMPVRDLAAYRAHCRRGFEASLGLLASYRVLALLPSYLERGDSGLVAMVDDFISGAAPVSGFFLDARGALVAALARARAESQPVLLWGVTFALLELVALGGDLRLPPGSLVVETGGMKGRGPELTRAQVHERLEPAFGVRISSEYGMTELSSQAYLEPDGRFCPMPALRVLAREPNDPHALQPPSAQGALNVYDLANVDTCSFIHTDDLGRVHADGRFEVLGRLDASILRGCNLLI